MLQFRSLMLVFAQIVALLAPQAAHAAWPIAPFNQSHPVRGSFMDARENNYHHGVDVPVDDARPDRAAPRWASHRIYAIRSGTVSYQASFPTDRGSQCTQNRTAVGNVIYYHVVSTVYSGTYVRQGQPIGWSCRGRWHVHVTEGFGSSPYNPLRRGGSLGPYRNPLKPVVEAIVPFTPCEGRFVNRNARALMPRCGRKLHPWALKGLVDIRFKAHEPQPQTGGLFSAQPVLYAPNHPYQASIRIDRLWGRLDRPRKRLVSKDRIWRSDSLAGQPPLTVHWAPGFARWLPMWACKRTRDYKRCEGAYWYRGFARYERGAFYRYWDTTRLPDGRYRVTISLVSTAGKRSARIIDVMICNRVKCVNPVAERPTVPEQQPTDPPAAEPADDQVEGDGSVARRGGKLYEIPVPAASDEGELDQVMLDE